MTVARLLVLAAGSVLPTVGVRRGSFDRLIREAVGTAWPGRWETRDVRAGAPLPGPRDADAFVITGSSSSVTERTPWMLRTEALVRAIDHAHTPLLGICFGHQIIAQALGGAVTLNPRGREIGTTRLVRAADDPIYEGLPRTFEVNGTHVDAVTRAPPGAEILGATPRDPVASFRVGVHTRAVQFHPEFDADVMRGYVLARAAAVRGEGGDPEALLSGIRTTSASRILANFARWALR